MRLFFLKLTYYTSTFTISPYGINQCLMPRKKTFHAQMKILLNGINYDLEHIAAPCVLYLRLGIRVLSNI